jgi:hypothetical protein
MTRHGMANVAKLAAENGEKAAPLDEWTDFRFQEEVARRSRSASASLAVARCRQLRSVAE